MGNAREGSVQKGSRVLSLDDLQSGGTTDRKVRVKRVAMEERKWSQCSIGDDSETFSRNV